VRIVLLADGASGSGSGPTPGDLAALIRAEGAEVEVMSPREAAGVPAARPDRVVVASGDGGVGPAADAAGAAGVPLAVVPAGTANDFARRMRLPEDVVAACRLAVHGRALRRMDLGRAGDRPFVNVASAGLPVRATRAAAPLKRVLGPAAYAVGGVGAGLLARPLPTTVSVDGRPLFAGRAWQVMVACAGGFGGGARIEGADPGDGLLDVVIIPAGSRRRLAGDARALRRGRIAGRPGVTRARGREVVVGLPPGTELNVDGELVPADGPLRVEPGRFRLVTS
jgi:diacylglycerol kinase family enzyme